ncbi:uncharacterized protein PV09_05467 [Verruconis gallopava]|uniref:CsbD-like domain-containing protein n=1 Tax=Verruconis gallopava TaxID=253628 RepID=A0A0D1XLE4_9PEZI|nr:uncharacterized protein PV09_05467 [Verruconis gallopava]KIW03246.1 hypothetical protein PV09_05467 [Verruconis gallopava]
MSDGNKNSTSTLQSYIDSASATVSSAISSITGNAADQAKADQKKAEAQAESDLSHAGANLGPVSVSASGVAANDPNRSAGSWNQTIGAGKEFVGGLIGAEGLKNEGIKQNQEGKAQEAQGQLNDLSSGIADRAKGAVGGAIAGLTGDTAEQERRQLQHDQGKTLQRGVEADLQ